MHEQLKSDVEKIVEEGERVSERVRDAVEDAAGRAKATPSRLSELTQAAIDGAVNAADRSAPDNPESTLRQVVDGVTDALQRTAQATRLAVEEAAGDGRAYAEDELHSVAADFRTVADMFVETVERAATGARDQTSKHVHALRDHAERTFNAARPSIEDAAKAAATHPISLAGESVAATAKLTREAAGGLFSAVGKLLQSTGDRISPKDKAAGDPPAPSDQTPS